MPIEIAFGECCTLAASRKRSHLAHRLARAVTAALILVIAMPGLAAADPFRLIVTDLETPLVPNSVMDLAERLGYFDREGVDVEFVRVQQTPSAVAALQAGEGEMANITVDAVLQLVGRGALDLRAVASPNKSLPFLIAAKTDIAIPAELAGRSFGVGRIGSLDHALSTKVLLSQGVAADAMQFVTLGQPAVRAQALAAGQIDATTLSVGVWTALPDKRDLHILVSQDAYHRAAPLVNKVNVVTAETLRTRRPEVEAVTRAIMKASRDFARDFAVWVEAMAAARPDVTRGDLEALAAAFAQGWSVNGGMNRAELENTAEWTYQGPDFGDVPRIPLAAWVDFSVVDAVLAAIGTEAGADQPGR